MEVLYIPSDDSHPILCRKEAIPFEQLIEVPGMTKDSVWYLDAILDQLAVDMVSGTEMDVKGVVLLQILVLAKERAEHVVSVTGAAGSDGSESAACFCALCGTARRYAMGDREKLSQHGRAHL